MDALNAKREKLILLLVGRKTKRALDQNPGQYHTGRGSSDDGGAGGEDGS
jgi:hypothetical protein